MPTLEFKGKQSVYSHHLSVPFRELIVDPKKSLPAKGEKPSLDDNLIIHGDNLEALKALLPRYAGKVDVIYIDPPYNTGKEGWAYNDKVNSPLMKQWLGKVVDRDDLERHDKWLCMIWPRLELLRELLSSKGVFLVSIDDNEAATCRKVLDELFREENWLGTIVWKSATDNNPTRIAVEPEYVVCFAKDVRNIDEHWTSREGEARELMLTTFDRLKANSADLDQLRKEWNRFVKEARSALGDLYRYRHIDSEGPYVARRNLENPGKPGYDYDIIHPTTQRPCTKPYWGWRFSEAAMRDLLDNDRIIFGKDETKIPELKVPLREVGFPLRSVLEMDSRKGSNDLEALFGTRDKFKNPKPVELLDYLFSYTTGQRAIVLDSFAGSGTTAHAVLAANQRDGGERRFILVEMEDYADTLTAERVRRVIKGVPNAKDEALKNGLGGSFTYCELGEPIDLDRFFNGGRDAPAWDQVARYIVFTATGASLETVPDKPDDLWFVGEAGGYRIHLIYRPDRDWMKSDEAALTAELAGRIAKAASNKPVLIYAAQKFMSQKALPKGVTFCQLPYAIYRILGDATDA